LFPAPYLTIYSLALGLLVWRNCSLLPLPGHNYIETFFCGFLYIYIINRYVTYISTPNGIRFYMYTWELKCGLFSSFAALSLVHNTLINNVIYTVVQYFVNFYIDKINNIKIFYHMAFYKTITLIMMYFLTVENRNILITIINYY